MRRLLPFLLLLLAPPAQPRDLVLVVRADSPVATLDSLTIRKLYFGFTVTAGESELQAMRLAGDRSLDQAFLQNVVGMSESQYESRLLRLTLKQGRPAPRKLSSPEEIVGQLSRNPNAIGCLWADQVAGRENLRIVKLLWRE